MSTLESALFQRGWRGLLIKTALLTVLWLVLTFVFATESYLASLTGPVKIPWRLAVTAALRDWLPWILLSPAVVILAGRFRFERGIWRRSLLVHLAAGIAIAVAYEGLFLLRMKVIGGSGGFVLHANFDAPTHEIKLPPDFPAATPSNGVFHMAVGHSPIGATGAIRGGVIVAMHGSVIHRSAALVGTNTPEAFMLPEPPRLRRWTPLLHLAAVRTQFTIPVYWCVVCLCWVINHFQAARERERRTLELEAQLSQANLRALKMQVQPHFLFNTLNAISSLIHENPKAADDMVGSLSQFLRTTLDLSSENEVPLRTELEFMDRYLEIQQARFGERLRIVREVEANSMNALVPALVLQPLVENAIRHGIEVRESVGTVVIRAGRDRDRLLLEISDDGEGFKGGQLLKASEGIGLSNTKGRLKELYGDKHLFKLTANEPTGARVIMEIPFRDRGAVPQSTS